MKQKIIFITKPHGAHTLSIVEEGKDFDDTIFQLSADFDSISILGSELRSLASYIEERISKEQ